MRRHWFIRLEFKPADLWVGVFWERGVIASVSERETTRLGFDAWVCLVPTLPIHFGWRKY